MGFYDHHALWLIDVAIAATRRARMRARRKGVCGRSTKMIERWRMPLGVAKPSKRVCEARLK